MPNVPTPPEPAWMSTFCPCFRCARSISACQAVKPTSGMEAASSMLSALGLIATSSSLIAGDAHVLFADDGLLAGERVPDLTICRRRVPQHREAASGVWSVRKGGATAHDR